MSARSVPVSLRACLRCSVGSVFSESSARDSLWRGETEKTRPLEGRERGEEEGRKRRQKRQGFLRNPVTSEDKSDHMLT